MCAKQGRKVKALHLGPEMPFVSRARLRANASQPKSRRVEEEIVALPARDESQRTFSHDGVFVGSLRGRIRRGPRA